MRLKKRPKKRNQITASWQMSDGACSSLLAFTTSIWATLGNSGQLLATSSALFGLLTESDPE